MKKLLILSVMVLMTLSAFGKSPVLKAIFKAKTYNEALALLKDNFDQLADDQEKAAAYNKLVELLADYIEAIEVTPINELDYYKLQEKMLDAVTKEERNAYKKSYEEEKHKFWLGFYDAVAEVFKAESLCDIFDMKPNSKGEIKPKYHNKNFFRLYCLQAYLTDAIKYFTSIGFDPRIYYKSIIRVSKYENNEELVRDFTEYHTGFSEYFYNRLLADIDFNPHHGEKPFSKDELGLIYKYSSILVDFVYKSKSFDYDDNQEQIKLHRDYLFVYVGVAAKSAASLNDVKSCDYYTNIYRSLIKDKEVQKRIDWDISSNGFFKDWKFFDVIDKTRAYAEQVAKNEARKADPNADIVFTNKYGDLIQGTILHKKNGVLEIIDGYISGMPSTYEFSRATTQTNGQISVDVQLPVNRRFTMKDGATFYGLFKGERISYNEKPTSLPKKFEKDDELIPWNGIIVFSDGLTDILVYGKTREGLKMEAERERETKITEMKNRLSPIRVQLEQLKKKYGAATVNAMMKTGEVNVGYSMAFLNEYAKVYGEYADIVDLLWLKNATKPQFYIFEPTLQQMQMYGNKVRRVEAKGGYIFYIVNNKVVGINRQPLIPWVIELDASFWIKK